jgi:hypothetical protein
MRQALHIFKKDVRHFRFEIAIAISVVVAFTIIEMRHALSVADPVTIRTGASTLVLFLLPLVWWTLIARVVHDEALAGNRQFWITRPYSWRSLLGAKVLFIFAFINLPMLVADMVILRAYGFSLGAELPGLLWSQVLLTIVYLLPIIALAAVTTGFVQLSFAILMPFVIVLIFAMFQPGVVLLRPVFFLGRFAGGIPVGYEWVKSYFAFIVITACASVILFWQYSRRGTTVARCLAAAGGILVVLGFTLISWNAAFKIQNWLSKEQVDLSSARVAPDSINEGLSRFFRQGEDSVGAEIPLQIMGLPPNMRVRVEKLSVDFQSPDGSVWKTDGYSLRNVGDADQRLIVRTGLSGGSYKKVKDGSLEVRGSLYLTLFGHRQTTGVPFGDRPVVVPRIGVCSARESVYRRGYFLICSSAFRSPAAVVTYHFIPSPADTAGQDWSSVQRQMNSYSPFPADLGLSPVSQDFKLSSNRVPADHGLVETMEPVAHIRLDFDITNLRPGNAYIPPPTNSH